MKTGKPLKKHTMPKKIIEAQAMYGWKRGRNHVFSWAQPCTICALRKRMYAQQMDIHVSRPATVVKLAN